MTCHPSWESTRRSPSFWITILCVSLLLSLGTWQLYRLNWKTALIEQIQKAASRPAEEAVSGVILHPFQKVVLQGTFRHDLEFQWLSKTFDGQVGFHLITPLVTPQGVWVLVDRGFVPKSYTPLEVARPEGLVRLSGLARPASDHSYFTPDSNFEKRHLYAVDPLKIAQALNHAVAPYYVIQDTLSHTQGWPRPMPVVAHLRNNHLMYALTWYLLAAICVLIYFLSVRKSHNSHLSS